MSKAVAGVLKVPLRANLPKFHSPTMLRFKLLTLSLSGPPNRVFVYVALRTNGRELLRAWVRDAGAYQVYLSLTVL